MTLIDPLTLPDEIEGHDLQMRLWQPRRAPIDQVPHGGKRVIAPTDIRPPRLSESVAATANDDSVSTSRPQRASSKTPPTGVPRVLQAVHQGRRSLRALMHWEGVVERVEGREFVARLTPFEDGVPNPSRVEFTDFSIDDLANPDDQKRVTEGARFYWTIGRATNPAGTLTNVSLVRFRRVAPASPYRRQLAEAEADALLQYGSEQ